MKEIIVNCNTKEVEIIEKELTQEEIDELEKIQQESQNQFQEPTLYEKVASLQEENQMLKECILEMSEIVYGG